MVRGRGRLLKKKVGNHEQAVHVVQSKSAVRMSRFALNAELDLTLWPNRPS